MVNNTTNLETTQNTTTTEAPTTTSIWSNLPSFSTQTQPAVEEKNTTSSILSNLSATPSQTAPTVEDVEDEEPVSGTSYFSFLSTLDPSANTTTTTTATAETQSSYKQAFGETYSSLAYSILYFFISLIIVILLVLCYFSYSALILFVCKLAQSNILPTEINCEPYTDSKSIIEEKIINIFAQNDMSMKLKFSQEDNEDFIIKSLKNYKNSPSSNFFMNYIVAIFEQLLCFNYSGLNMTMNALNIFPEFIIVLFGPFIFSFIQGIIGIASAFYFLIIFFTNMIWFFRTNTTPKDAKKSEWEQVAWYNPFSYFIAIVLITGVIVAGFFGYKYLALLPAIILLYCVLSCFFYRVKINGNDGSAFKLILHTLNYYKPTIASITSIFMVILAFLILGYTAGIFSIITLILVFFGLIPVDIFSSSSLNGLSAMTDASYALAKKTCDGKPPKVEKQSIFAMFNFF